VIGIVVPHDSAGEVLIKRSMLFQSSLAVTW